ncbi:hypothetical protein ACTIVE_5995 [Actinomadura verrucosospora]|uniref:Uncharacterized protein n=1 Tax=Actinomadura verrucosospora TaxID=46165 RepID=A0A7D3W1W5_ACTVE|nr:hypothetical protein ACTIVE_5995 [Actinomadura verrucosospora]
MRPDVTVARDGSAVNWAWPLH